MFFLNKFLNFLNTHKDLAPLFLIDFKSFLLPRFALPFVKEVFEEIYFIILDEEKACDTNDFSCDDKGIVNLS